MTDGKVTLRPQRPDDVSNLYNAVWESLKELAAWMPWAHKDYSIRESRQWLKMQPEEWKKGFAYSFAILDAKDGTYLGGCGINRIDRENLSANLGYWVRTSRTAQGTAPAATRLLAAWAFRELKLNRIEIVVALENLRSQRVAEKAGAKREGIMRNRLLLHSKAHDAVLFSLIPGEV